MANTVINFGKSSEEVALALLHEIAGNPGEKGLRKMTRAEMLDLYTDCLEAVVGKRPRDKKS